MRVQKASELFCAPLDGPLRFDFYRFSAMSEVKQKPGAEETITSRSETSYAMMKRRWGYFHKPLLSIFIGALMFGTGTALSLLYFTQVGNVPYLVGPFFLSLGLMFLVTGLVWIPVIKQRMVHAAMSKMDHDRPLLPERGSYSQSCATIS